MSHHVDVTNIPDMTSPASAVYLLDFVEWDEDADRWVSRGAPDTRKAKLAEIADMSSPNMLPSRDEVRWLAAVEKDQKVAKKMEAMLANWKMYLGAKVSWEVEEGKRKRS